MGEANEADEPIMIKKPGPLFFPVFEAKTEERKFLILVFFVCIADMSVI